MSASTENSNARVLRAWERGLDKSPNGRVAMIMEEFSGRSTDIEQPLFLRDHVLLELLIAMRGPVLEAVVSCPGCDSKFQIDIDLLQIIRPPPAPESVSVETDGLWVTVRPPRPSDLVALSVTLSPSDYAEALFLRCVESAVQMHESVPAGKSPLAARAAAAAALAARGMQSPGADIVCALCGREWRAPLDVACAVIAAVEHDALRLLDDVHRIAAAYHWREEEILSLSPARRRYYLEAIG